MTGGRPAELRDAKLVSVWLEREDVEQIKKMGVERSAFVRDAVRRLLHGESALVKEKKELAEEVAKLRKEVAEKERRIRELEREVEKGMRRIAELEERLAKKGEKIEELREKVNAKQYKTSKGWKTAEEIREWYKKENPRFPKAWLSAILYNDVVAVEELSQILGIESSEPATATDPVPSVSSVSAEDAEKDAERERIERMLRAREVRRRRRRYEEWDFKRLAEDLGLTEEEARRIVAEKLAQSGPEGV